MITIQSALLVALGFLIASLLVLVLGPAYRRRTVRLATTALKQAMPLTEAEISADKDRLRAEYAIKVHKLETRLDEALLQGARQQIEVNRRDAAISALEGDLGRLKTSLEEHENARRVLEQTVTDRLPKVEMRLAEARKLLLERDRELKALLDNTARQEMAIEEATQINLQQRDEIHRLNAALTVRSARHFDEGAPGLAESEAAFQAEVEALRSQNREQATLIERLQGMVRDKIAASPDAAAALGVSANDAELIRLRNDLSEAEAALRSARGVAVAGQAGQAALAVEVRNLKSANQDQSAEIARLKGELETYLKAASDEQRSLKDTKIAMKARIAALEGESTQHAQTIQSLRAELAASNERLARQAAHFMDEMRRLGAGTLPPSAQGRRAAREGIRRPLLDRIAEPRPVRSQSAVTVQPEEAETVPAEASPAAAAAANGVGDAAAKVAANGTEGEAAAAPARRPRLLDRITGIEKAPTT